MDIRHILAAGVVIGLAFLLMGLGSVQEEPTAGAEPEGAEGTIEVDAVGEVEVSPDTAQVKLGVETRGDEAEEATEDNSTRMASVMDALQKIGISDDDMETADFSLQPVYEEVERDERELVGFAATNQLLVTIREVQQSGEVIDEAVAAGANVVGDLDFRISDRQEYEDEAIERAVERAWNKAEIAADQAGARIVGVEELNISDARAEMPREVMEAPAEDVPIVAGEVSVNVQVDLVLAVSR